MAKFYVQSGTMRSVVQAESTRKAAIWAVHQAMQQVLPMETEDCPQTTSEKVGSRGVAVLAGKVSVSERGFDAEDASSMPTMEVVAEWNQMVTTLDRLQRMLYRVA
jgi:hypothetical protein